MNQQEIIDKVCKQGESITITAQALAEIIIPMGKLTMDNAPIVYSFLNSNDIDCNPNIFVCVDAPLIQVTLSPQNINTKRKLVLNRIYIQKYKLLNDFSLAFSDKNISILIGENGSGKSTLVEYIATLFALIYIKSKGGKIHNDEYDLGAFIIEYSLNNEISNINVTITNEGKDFAPIMFIGNKKLSKINNDFLPKNIIVSYSGITKRLEYLIKGFFEIPFVKEIYQNGDKYSLMPYFKLPDNSFYYSRSEYLESFFISLLFSKSDEAKELITKCGFDNFHCIIQFITLTPEYLKSIVNNNYAYEEIMIGGQKVTRLKGKVAPQFINLLERAEQDRTIDTITYTFDGFQNVEAIFKLCKEDITPKQVFDILYYLIHNKLLGKININWGENLEFSLDTISEGQKQEIMTLGLSLIFDAPSSLFLLDEPDTYLHPKWQREFISSLTKATANGGCAIVTSHSPIILANAENAQVYILNKGKIQKKVPQYYGRTVRDILYELMGGVEERDPKITKKLDSLSAFLEEGNLDESERLYNDLLSILGENDADLYNLKMMLDDLKEDSDNETNNQE